MIIMRRTQGSCQYGLQYLTHPRELEDDEMIEIAKQMEESTPFGESKAFYKLYNTAKGAVFYFENGERDRELFCQFEMEIENLAIVGEDPKANKFSITLGPKENTVRMLKPVVDGEATSI